jgi:hypothetical protein
MHPTSVNARYRCKKNRFAYNDDDFFVLRSPDMKKSVSILLATLILATGSITLLGQGAPTTEKLASGTYIVYAISPQVWRFTVDSKTMANATVSGRFNVTAGMPTNLEVFVFNEENFTKWRGTDEAAKAAAKPVWSSGGRKTEGEINVKLTEPGHYYLVYSNLFAYEGTKTFTTDVKLTYDKR